MKHTKKLYFNTVTSLIYQIVTLVAGLILPRQILTAFGSDVNGLIVSITRFLSFISFMELGIGPVIQSNLYKPLADNKWDEVSRIYISADRFYKRIAYVFLIYIAGLIFVYPSINNQFGFIYTAMLIVIISISTFAQYYFGITNQVLLNADQKIYVSSIIQIVSVVLNTVISVVLINVGCSIHIVKLVSTVVFVIKPFFLNFYVGKRYDINKKIKVIGEPIKQKWNGFYQHLAGIVCGETDVILLTIFSTNQNVSIYSVYYMVVLGITNLLINTVSGLTSYWGNTYALGEKDKLQDSFENVEHVIHAIVILIFSCCAILIEPFVRVYVSGINDAIAYNVPIFGMLISLAYAFQCMRIPYDRITKAAGHYKETQNGALISMILNLVISILLVKKVGLIGVAIGTIIAMFYHTVYLAWYIKKEILKRKMSHFIKHCLVDILAFILIYSTTRWVRLSSLSYFSWAVCAMECFMSASVVIFILYFIFYRDYLVRMMKKNR